MRLFQGFAACLLASAFAVAGCSSAEPQEPQQPQHAVHSIAPVNNVQEAIENCNRPAGKGVLMSFDDHGTPQQVRAILDKLRQHQMRAAFFPTGTWAEQNLDLIDQMKSDGHIVGNHTYTHADLGQLSAHDESRFYGEIFPLRDVANTDPMLLRPPFEAGAYDPVVGQRLTGNNVQGCTWTADTHDWDGSPVEVMMNRLRFGDQFSRPLGPDGVILAHMHGQHSLALIDSVVQYLNEMNWAYERTA